MDHCVFFHLLYHSAPVSANYEWSISGNGAIVGSTNSQSVSVTAGSSSRNILLSLKSLSKMDVFQLAPNCYSCRRNITNCKYCRSFLNQTRNANTAGITAAFNPLSPAVDNCTLAPTKVLVSDVTTVDANCTFARVRTWNFTDGCTNTSANLFKIHTDNTAPVVTTVEAS
jgi:hypothetical protein